MNVSTNWSEIFSSVGEYDVIQFAKGHTSARHFESLSSSTRRLVRSFGASKARELARRALNRRNCTQLA